VLDSLAFGPMVDLPPGLQPRRPQISREYLETHRRRRYVDAIGELLHEFGREGVTTTNIVRLAGTARNSFYEVFPGAEGAIAYGCEVALGEMSATLDSVSGDGDWLVELHAAIVGFYDWVLAEPLLAELLLIHSAGSRLEEGRATGVAAQERFMPLLARGRLEAETIGRAVPPGLTEELMSRSIVTLAARRVRERSLSDLPAEAEGIAAMIGGFYLGWDAVGRIGDRPTPKLSPS
jgi:AcrR family transcriptional regulator